MEKKKTEIIDELKSLLINKKVVIGTEIVMKKLKLGELKEILVTSNAPADILNDLNKYCDLAKVNLRKLSQTNEELGVICKKPFMISIIGVLK